MKKILILLGLFVMSSAFSLDANAPQGKIKVGEGTKITYAVNFMGAKYDFIVNVTGRDAGVTFDYEMTDKNNTKGKVAISPDAMKTAHKLNNYFNGGEMKLREATTVWLSSEMYNEYKSGSTTFDMGNGKEVLTLKEKQKMVVKIGGKEKKVKVLFGETDGYNKFWVLDDKNNPIILKMDIGWQIEIKEIN